MTPAYGVIALEVFEIDPVWMTVIVTNDIIIMALLGRTNTNDTLFSTPDNEKSITPMDDVV